MLTSSSFKFSQTHMPTEPIEKNHERFSDEALRVKEVAKATPDQSKKALRTILETKNDRMRSFELPKNPKSREQLESEREIIDRRLTLIRAIA